MAFSYPSHALIAYGLLAAFSVLAFFRGRLAAAFVLGGILLITAIGLLAGGYLQYSRRVFAENELWNNIFQAESFTLIQRGWEDMAVLVLLNKYSVTWAVALALSWQNRDLRDLVLVVGGFACALACVGLFNTPQLWDRFLGRGIDHLWVTCMTLALVAGWQRALDAVRASRVAAFLTRAFSATIVAGILFVAGRGFGEYALATAHNLTRFMPEGRWAALQWIDRNVQPGTSVAAIDWDDITFIPIYTRAKLMVDNMVIGGRGPVDEMKRYVALWKILGYDRAVLERRLVTTTQSALQRFRSKRPRNPPLVDAETYASGQIAEALVYWPYVKTVNGIAIAGPNYETTAEFVVWAMALYDAADPRAAVKEYDVRLVVVSGVERQFEPVFAVNYKLLFENATHRVYAVAQ